MEVLELDLFQWVRYVVFNDFDYILDDLMSYCVQGGRAVPSA